MRDEQRQPVEPPIAEDDKSMHLAESDSSDSDEDNNDYEIEHDPGLRIPIFSIMNFVKNKLRSKMGQKFLNGCLVTFIEREFFFQAKD